MSLVRVQSGEPFSKSKLRCKYNSPIVQLVERRTVNPYVTGSSPVWGANIYCYRNDSPIVQLVERRTVNPYVTGSSPVWGAISKSKISNNNSPVVQLVERRTVNPYVTGSSPVWGAIMKRNNSHRNPATLSSAKHTLA